MINGTTPMAPKNAAVSVVIPCYKCVHTVRRAVSSVAAQTLMPVEVILVDDFSQDDTLDMLFELKRLYPKGWIQVIALPVNRGPGEARNAGWERASQSYIAFLDSDDSWHPQKIELQYRWMEEHPDVALTGHSVLKLKSEGEPSKNCRVEKFEAGVRTLGIKSLLLSNSLATSSVMLRRFLPVRFVINKSHSEDYLLWLTIACSGVPIARSKIRLSFMHKAPYGEAGLSGQLRKMHKGELDTYNKVRKQGCVTDGLYRVLIVWSWVRFLKRMLMVCTFAPVCMQAWRKKIR